MAKLSYPGPRENMLTAVAYETTGEMYSYNIFVTVFCGQYIISVLDAKLTSFTDGAWFHVSDS
jgi:hypothetical protein